MSCCKDLPIGSPPPTPPIGVMWTRIIDVNQWKASPLTFPQPLFSFYAQQRGVVVNHSNDIYDYRLIFIRCEYNTQFTADGPLRFHGIDRVVTQSEIPGDWTGRVVLVPTLASVGSPSEPPATSEQVRAATQEVIDALIDYSGQPFEYTHINFPDAADQYGVRKSMTTSAGRNYYKRRAAIGGCHYLSIGAPSYIWSVPVRGGFPVWNGLQFEPHIWSPAGQASGDVPVATGARAPLMTEITDGNISWVMCSMSNRNFAVDGFFRFSSILDDVGLGADPHQNEPFWGALYDTPPSENWCWHVPILKAVDVGDPPTITVTIAGDGGTPGTPVEFNTSDTFVVSAAGEYTIECWGGGGAGGYDWTGPGGSGGGGGGAYAKLTTTLTPGSYTVTVGTGGSGSGQAGGDTWVGSTSLVLAKGGAAGSNASGGAGGQASASVGDVKHNGGTGGTRGSGPNGAGGGAAAKRDDTGNSGGDSSGLSVGIGGVGVNGGGSGGDGGDDSGATTGQNGQAPGGGGGGGSNANGGAGAAGRVIITPLSGHPCDGTYELEYDADGSDSDSELFIDPDGECDTGLTPSLRIWRSGEAATEGPVVCGVRVRPFETDAEDSVLGCAESLEGTYALDTIGLTLTVDSVNF